MGASGSIIVSEILDARGIVSGGCVLPNTVVFSEPNGNVTWQGRQVVDQDNCQTYLSGQVRTRLADAAHQNLFANDMAALASTDVAVDTLSQLLSACPRKEPWEVGEAIAECVLEEEFKVIWPWNHERDKRTPRASLPGADLIGFVQQGSDVYLALGEVKTSNDSNAPPGVMQGRGGMIHQLDTLARTLSIHRSLISWLHTRCKHTEFWPLFESALTRYLDSKGQAIVLFGILMRDTSPTELDLRNRGRALATAISEHTHVELMAWYLPHKISDWPLLVEGTP